MTRKTHACPAYGHGRYTDAGWAFHTGWCKFAKKAVSRTVKVAEPLTPVLSIPAPGTPEYAAWLAQVIAQVLKSLAS